METIGSLTDKICIADLRIFHLKQKLESKVSGKIRRRCQLKLEIISQQKNDLIAELNILHSDVVSGKKKIKVYRQFKSYISNN